MISYNPKSNPSSDEELKLIPPKLELLVNVSYHITLNFVSRLYKPPVNGLEIWKLRKWLPIPSLFKSIDHKS